MQKYKGKNLHFRLLNHSVEIKKKMPNNVSFCQSVYSLCCGSGPGAFSMCAREKELS